MFCVCSVVDPRIVELLISACGMVLNRDAGFGRVVLLLGIISLAMLESCGVSSKEVLSAGGIPGQFRDNGTSVDSCFSRLAFGGCAQVGPTQV